MSLNWIDPAVLDQRSSGEELLVGFGENESDHSLSDLEAKDHSQTEEKQKIKFFGRFRGGEKKEMDRTGSGSVVSSSNNSFLSMGGSEAFRSRIKKKVENAFNKLHRADHPDRISESNTSGNGGGNQSLPPVVYFDPQDKDVSSTTICSLRDSVIYKGDKNNSLSSLDLNNSGRQKHDIESVTKTLDYGDFGRWKNVAKNSDVTLGYGDSDRWRHNKDNYLNSNDRENKKEPMEERKLAQEVNNVFEKTKNNVTSSPNRKDEKKLKQPSQEKQPVVESGTQHKSNFLRFSGQKINSNDVSENNNGNKISTTEAQHEVLDPFHSSNETTTNQAEKALTISSNGSGGDPDGRFYFKTQTSSDSYSTTMNKSESITNLKKGNNRKNVAINPKGLQTYKKKIVKKSDASKQMIFDAIKSNILFILWTKQEIYEFIDTFQELIVKAGETIFNEGDEGTYFYILESGSVNVFKQSALAGAIEGCGATFGDVALLYDAPRNSTFRAETKCKLWIIDRMDYRGVSRLNNKSKADQKITFLKKVKIGRQIMGDVLEISEIYNIALATQSVSFVKGDRIIKEGDKGDTFYIIKSGLVDVYIKSCGDEPIRTMSIGQFIGEKAMVQEQGVRTATCVVTSDFVECLTLEREDFSKMLGDVKWMFEEVNNREKHFIPNGQPNKDKITTNKDEDEDKGYIFKLEDFEMKQTIGIGAFGQVKLAKSKVFLHGKIGGTYVLKCQDLKIIEENNMMEHIKSEQKIMEELDHPFIIKFYGALNDSNHTYFLLELLQGGELFRLLLEKNRFPEAWSRFYAGTVLSAFYEIHVHNFVYRDLKPENLVLDSKGYPKIVDFGLAKKLEGGKTWTLCGTPDYMPPEVILNEGHDSAADYWSLGILLYELTSGTPPFTSEYPMDVYKNILSGNLIMPEFFSDCLKDLIQKLLNPRQATRIGRTFGGTKQIMKQKFFSSLNFEELQERRVKPPFIPVLENDDDMKYFNRGAQLDSIGMSTEDVDHLPEETKQTTSIKSKVTFSFSKLSSKSSQKSSMKRSSSRQKIRLTASQNRHASTISDMISDSKKKNGRRFRNLTNELYRTQPKKKDKADSFLMIQLMNLALSDNIKDQSKLNNPFKQFTLLSVLPDTLCQIAFNDNCYVEDVLFYNGLRYMDPIYLNAVDVIDSFPVEKKIKRRGSSSHLAPEALSAFCFPEGLSIRLLPRCAIEGAKTKRIRFMGKESDVYQLHAFTNGSGDRRHAIAITIREEIHCNDKDMSIILEFLKTYRRKRQAGRVILEAWHKFLKKRANSSFNSMSQGDEIKHFFHKSSKLVGRMKNTLRRTNSQSSSGRSMSQQTMNSVGKSEQSIASVKNISTKVKQLAAEAYKFMVEADRQGEVCIVEKCYVMIGTKLKEQSLILNALQKFVDVEREDAAVRKIFTQSGNPIEDNSTLLVSNNRHKILQMIQNKLRLSPAQIKKTFMGRKSSAEFEVDLSIGNHSKISLPLPLPHMSREWGFAVLIRCIKIPNILIALKLLLMERSILLIGTSTEEVSACSCTLLELLHPYKWASAFMPLLPVNLLDIVESPVPFIGGIVLKDTFATRSLESDERVQNALREGMSIINLTSKRFIPTQEAGVVDVMNKCYDPISHILIQYQYSLLKIMEREDSVLNSFKNFFDNGPSAAEAKILDVMIENIRNYLGSLSCSLSRPDGYKQFGILDPSTNEFDFYPDKFLEPLRAQLQFQEAMISTQLFLSYIEDKKNNLDLLEGSAAILIANWLQFRWRLRKNKVTRSKSESIS